MSDALTQIKSICVKCQQHPSLIYADVTDCEIESFMKLRRCSYRLCLGCPYRLEIEMIVGNNPDQLAIIKRDDWCSDLERRFLNVVDECPVRFALPCGECPKEPSHDLTICGILIQ